MGTSGGLQIWLLGGFRVELDGRPVGDEEWRRNRPRALVKLLALAPEHRLHREQLMDALWPELDAQAEGTNLRKAIHFARQALAPEHVRVRGGVVALEAPRLWVDVDAFTAAARSGDVPAALELYRGDLLPEDRFEPWSEDARQRLRSVYHGLLLEAADGQERRGELDEAAGTLERLVASDPLHEDGYFALIRVHGSAGARHLALRRYRQLEARLRDELGVEPADAVRQLHQAILEGRSLPSREPASATPVDTTATARDGPPAPARRPTEERRLVTVLRTDPLARTGDPELTRRQLGAWSEVVRLVLEDWGASAEAQTGGPVAAVFGVPNAHEDDAPRALRAALEIVERAPLPTRVGIATGEVIAMIGGAPGPGSTAGDVLVDADRLREAAEFGTVLVGERSSRAVGDTFRFAREPARDIGPDRLVARRLLGEERTRRRARRPEAPLIGRDADLAEVERLFDDVVGSGRPHLVVLYGSAGVGKSRLVNEAAARLPNRHPGMRTLKGRSLPAGRGAVYWALGEIVREACGISLGDSAEVVQRRLRDTVGGLMGDLDPAETHATAFALATTAAIDLPGNPLDSLHPDEVSKRLALAWPRFATACATHGPTLIVLEDLHWASPELLAMTELIVARSSGPLLVLATARPELREAHPSFGTAGVDMTAIAVRPLTDAQSEGLLDSLLAGASLDGTVREQLLSRAEGNPFYLEQLIHHVDDEGTATLPDTLQSLLAARLGSLSLPDRRVLQEAAVVGRVFWEAPLLPALDDVHVAARLDALERSGFVVRRPTSSLPGQAEFMFRHALLHDVAYESMPRGRRARAHAAVGEWLEGLAGDRVDEVADLLANHFASAVGLGAADLAWDDPAHREVVRAKAVEYLLRAGDAARRRFATDRAVVLHERGLGSALGPRERLLALEALADDHESNYHGDQAAAYYRESIELARGDPSLSSHLARLCRKLAWMMAWNPGSFHASADPADVEALVAEGMRVAEDEAERAWLLLVDGATARLYRGSEPFGQGTRADSRPIADRIAAVEQAQATGDALGRQDVIVSAGHALGMLYGIAGRYDDMLELARREVAALGPNDSRLDRADAIRKLAVQLVNVRADFEEGLTLGRRCQELTPGNSPHQVMHACWPVMAALFHLGRFDEVLPVLDIHIAAFRTDPALECQFVRDGPAIGAAALSVLGRLDEASETAALLGDPSLDRERASAWQSRYATLSGDPGTAREISADKALQGRTYGPQHAFALLEALAALEDWEAALAFLPVARGSIPGNALLAPMADRVEGQGRLASGDRDGGLELLRRAADAFGHLGATFEVKRTLEAMRLSGDDRTAGAGAGVAGASPRGRGQDPSGRG